MIMCIMCIQNLVLISLFVFKILSKNLILTSIKGRNSVANLPKFELIQAFMHVLVTCTNEDDRLKTEGADFSNYKSMGIFDAQGQLTPPKFELIQAFMHVLVTFMHVLATCKNDDRFKNMSTDTQTTATGIL